MIFSILYSIIGLSVFASIIVFVWGVIYYLVSGELEVIEEMAVKMMLGATFALFFSGIALFVVRFFENILS